MRELNPELGAEQWRFLATMESLGGTVHINILDNLAPSHRGTAH